jgi:hypothetical protein
LAVRELGGVILGAVFAVSMFGAWLTHVISCIDHERWGFLIAGAIFFPVAIVHGIGIWLGVW